MNYEVVDKKQYYRSGVFRHFTEDCKCSTSMTARIDVSVQAKLTQDIWELRLDRDGIYPHD